MGYFKKMAFDMSISIKDRPFQIGTSTPRVGEDWSLPTFAHKMPLGLFRRGKAIMTRPSTSLLHRNFLSWPSNFRIYITFYVEFKNKC